MVSKSPSISERLSAENPSSAAAITATWFTVAQASSKLAGGGSTSARKSCDCFKALYSSPRTLERSSAM
jgi:hypothetical protein